MEFNQDYKEMLSILNKYKVRYLIIGAYATIYYTEPRYMKQTMDIWVWREEKNMRIENSLDRKAIVLYN